MLRVVPVEGGGRRGGRRFASLSEALGVAVVGDVIELGIGHHWESNGLVVKQGIMIEGDENACDKVVLELSGTLKWEGRGGGIVGVTIRRPRRGEDEGPLVVVAPQKGKAKNPKKGSRGGRVQIVRCMCDSR